VVHPKSWGGKIRKKKKEKQTKKLLIQKNFWDERETLAIRRDQQRHKKRVVGKKKEVRQGEWPEEGKEWSRMPFKGGEGRKGEVRSPGEKIFFLGGGKKNTRNIK